MSYEMLNRLLKRFSFRFNLKLLDKSNLTERCDPTLNLPGIAWKDNDGGSLYPEIAKM